MSEPKALTGIEGRDAAFADPENWACSHDGEWESNIAWRDWSFVELSNPARKWRRTPKPEPVRPTEAELVAALRAGKEIREYVKLSGVTAAYQIRHVFSHKLDDVDRWGECSTPLDHACSNWFKPENTARTWTIIDPQPAQPEPAAEMTPEKARECLRNGTVSAVIGRSGIAWGPGDMAGASYPSNSNAPYTALLPATRTQVALERELAESRAKSSQLAEDNATMRDAMGHALSELSIYDATFPRATNATNWLASALHRTSRTRKS
jgi:hypothetical protein